MTTDKEIQDKLKFDLHIEFQEVISFAITKGGYMKEGNIPKASNCQIEINKHQENIKNIFQEMLDLKAKNTIKSKSQELRKRNPYKLTLGLPNFERGKHWGYEKACDELEKMENKQ